MDLEDRMADWGRRLADRESHHIRDLERAREYTSVLHARVAKVVDRFHESCEKAGAGHLVIELSDIRLDDKHVRAFQFDLTRGRQQLIFTVKSRGQVTIVGPFQMGKKERPCRPLPFESDEITAALTELLEKFIEAGFCE